MRLGSLRYAEVRRHLISPLAWLVMATGFLAATASAELVHSPPGIVVNHLPAVSGKYIGSPSLVRLPNGVLLASHDEFGPRSTEHSRATTQVFRSADDGESWEHLATVSGQFWSKLFCHQGSVYLLGTWKHHGNLVIRRSDDGGQTWTDPTDGTRGLLRVGQYHGAPQPMLVDHDRIGRAFEDAGGGQKWGERYRPFVMFAPVDADLLDSRSWTYSEHLPVDKSWLKGQMQGWLEGDLLHDTHGRLVNVLRVAGTNDVVGKAAIVQVAEDGRKLAFDPENGFVDLPGGCKKFTIQHDPETSRYWSLVNWVPPELAGTRAASSIRNKLALVSSDDLHHWQVERLVIDDQNMDHGYQYPDWLFDGEDLIAVVRTATDDGQGGPHSYHDANYLTFHRIRNFRQPRTDGPQKAPPP